MMPVHCAHHDVDVGMIFRHMSNQFGGAFTFVNGDDQHLRFLDAGGVEIQSTVIPNQPDGNVQLIQGPVSGVRTIVLELGGSGAITGLQVCPEFPSFQPAL